MAIIKCPECGHEVSDQASQCPFCGVQIENNIIPCPDCGKILLKNVKTCPNCGCVVAAADSSGSSKKKSYKPYPEHNEPKRKSHALVWVIVVIVVLGAAAGGFYFYRSQMANDNMEMAYQALENDTETADYEDFLQKYPQSPYNKSVTDRLNQLKTIQNKWTEISMSASKSDFVSFMSQFPNSAFENNCKQKIDSLDWVDASTENTALSYQRYIDEHPSGKYASEAQIGKENMDKMTVSYSDKSAVRDAVTRYFAALTNNDHEDLNAVVTDKLYDQSIGFMEKLHSENQQVSFFINSGINISKAPSPTTEFVFIAKSSVKRSITSNAGEVTNVVFNVIATLSPDVRIISIKMQKMDAAE